MPIFKSYSPFKRNYFFITAMSIISKNWLISLHSVFCFFSFIFASLIPPKVINTTWTCFQRQRRHCHSPTCEPHCLPGSPAQRCPVLPGFHSSVPQHWTRGLHMVVWEAQKLLPGDPIPETKQEIKFKANNCT